MSAASFNFRCSIIISRLIWKLINICGLYLKYYYCFPTLCTHTHTFFYNATIYFTISQLFHKLYLSRRHALKHVWLTPRFHREFDYALGVSESHRDSTETLITPSACLNHTETLQRLWLRSRRVCHTDRLLHRDCLGATRVVFLVAPGLEHPLLA